ncbi:60S ribosomal protein L28-like [Molossus molossus]|uniref:60S ribosomal protein L28-like n=1 Tax=Molossus molossus TaxID=27622 RepID=UPI0017463D96|nr:60S ribosomal protein L28-like [Molossus molossus]
MALPDGFVIKRNKQPDSTTLQLHPRQQVRIAISKKAGSCLVNKHARGILSSIPQLICKDKHLPDLHVAVIRRASAVLRSRARILEETAEIQISKHSRIQ